MNGTKGDRLYLGHHGCGCTIFRVNDKVIIDYCPKHKAAPDMYEALKVLVNKFETAGIILGFTEAHLIKELEEGRQALTKAKPE